VGDAELSLSEYAKDGLILATGVLLLAIGWRTEFFNGQTGAVLGAGLMLLGYSVRGLTETRSHVPSPSVPPTQ